MSTGHEPRRGSTRAGPEYDLAWIAGGSCFVVEVKSLTPENEERQLRMGLGQVLRYGHALRTESWKAAPILALERAPSDPEWSRMLAGLGVHIMWRGQFLDRVRDLCLEAVAHKPGGPLGVE